MHHELLSKHIEYTLCLCLTKYTYSQYNTNTPTLSDNPLPHILLHSQTKYLDKLHTFAVWLTSTAFSNSSVVISTWFTHFLPYLILIKFSCTRNTCVCIRISIFSCATIGWKEQNQLLNSVTINSLHTFTLSDVTFAGVSYFCNSFWRLDAFHLHLFTYGAVIWGYRALKFCSKVRVRTSRTNWVKERSVLSYSTVLAATHFITVLLPHGTLICNKTHTYRWVSINDINRFDMSVEIEHIHIDWCQQVMSTDLTCLWKENVYK